MYLISSFLSMPIGDLFGFNACLALFVVIGCFIVCFCLSLFIYLFVLEGAGGKVQRCLFIYFLFLVFKELRTSKLVFISFSKVESFKKIDKAVQFVGLNS